MKRHFLKFAVAATIAVMGVGTTTAQAQTTEITLWSHWAAEQIKRSFVEDAVKSFEAANPNTKVKISWYEKTALYAALKTSLRAGQGPDIFYAEPDQVEYMENGLLLDLSSLKWSNVEPWAKEAWTWKGKPYGLPLEAWTVELYYNKDLLKELGINLPASQQLSANDFGSLVAKAKARNLTPMALGVGDRPFPGTHVTHEALLQRLGVADYNKLLNGGIAWDDPRVISTLKWVKTQLDAGLLPGGFSTLKLGEAHTYFHTNPKAVTFINGSWYTSRAFNAPDKGGQPVNFPLGIMKYPAVPGAVCPECKTMAVGGSYVVNAATKAPAAAIAFLSSLATPEMGNRWLENVLVQTGIKTDAGRIGGANAAYFKMLADVNKNAVYQFGMPAQIMQGKVKETYTQIFNSAFLSGAISVEDAAKQMKAAY